MNYELAKQLKDAGFPQDRSPWIYLIAQTGENEPHHVLSVRFGNHGYKPKEILGSIDAPTLSELIESCMVLMKPTEQFPSQFNFFELYPLINTTTSSSEKKLGDIEQWGASCSKGLSLDDIEIRNNYFGSTPEEAVARLLLALNKKKL